MASQPPMILADNVFDRINLYPAATLLAPQGSAPGREPNYVADYRRERTFWQGVGLGAGQYVVSDLGAGNVANPDTLWIDRGHNLWGKSVRWYNSTEDVNNPGVVYDVVIRDVPAQGTVGGDPTVGWCVTEEGAIYTFQTFVTPRQVHTVYLYPDVFATPPTIPGIIMGKRTQMLNYSSVLDEDEGERFERQENSLIPGYYGRDRIHTARKLRVQLATIGATEYDNQVRSLRRMLFERDQPAFIVMNYGLKPERGWLYQYQGSSFSAPTERVYRRTSFVMGELGPLIR